MRVHTDKTPTPVTGKVSSESGLSTGEDVSLDLASQGRTLKNFRKFVVFPKNAPGIYGEFGVLCKLTCIINFDKQVSRRVVVKARG